MEDAVVIRVKREKDANDTLALAETAASTTLKAISLAPGTVGTVGTVGDNSASSAEETRSNESELWLVGDNGRLVKLVDINTRINSTEHNRYLNRSVCELSETKSSHIEYEALQLASSSGTKGVIQTEYVAELV